MKAVMCDPLNGSWPAWDKFRKYGLNRIYVSAIDNAVRPATPDGKGLVQGIRSQGFEAGIYRDPHWNGSSATDLGLQASRDLKAAGIVAQSDQCAYLFDIEVHDSQFVLDTIGAFKRNRPTREYAWTLEPFQGGDPQHGGWITQALCDTLNADQFATAIPQCYLGGMEPCSEIAVVQDLVTIGTNPAYGLNPSTLAAFYDGIRGAPAGMDGVIFTDGRLP